MNQRVSGPTLGDPGTWTENGPRYAGRLVAVAVQQAAGGGVGTMIVGTPGGGVWTSTDGGDNFSWPLNYGLGDFTVLDIQWDRASSSRLYLKTWNGVYASTDNAGHWSRLLYSNGTTGGDTSYRYPSARCGGVFPACPSFGFLPGIEPKPFAQMMLPSTTTNVLLNSFGCGGLQYSYDNGTTWQQDWPAAIGTNLNPDNCIYAIAGDEATGKVYLATSTFSNYLWRSTSPWPTTAPSPSALGWELVMSGISDVTPPLALAWSGASDELMMVTDSSSSPAGARFYTSNYDATVNPPLSWTTGTFPGTGGCGLSTARPLIWGGTGSGFNDMFVGGTSIAYTANYGSSWTCPNLTQQHGDVRGIFVSQVMHTMWDAMDQNDLGTHYVLNSYPWTPGSGLGTGTGHYALGISSWQVYGVGVQPPTSATGPRRLLLGPQDTGVACSDDAGSTWSEPILHGGESMSALYHPAGDGNLAYIYWTQGLVWQSLNAGNLSNSCAGITLRQVSSNPTTGVSVNVGPHMLTVHPTNLDMLYYADSTSVMVSANARSASPTWTPSPMQVDTAGRPHVPTSVYVDSNGYGYVGTLDYGVFRCTDLTSFCSTSPSNWTSFGTFPTTSPPHQVLALTQSSRSATIYWWAATTDGVYRMQGGTNSWTKVFGLNGYVYSDVVVDPSCPTRVYAGVGYLTNESRSRGGVIYSSSNGDVSTWSSISSGFQLHNSPVTQIYVDPLNQKVLVTTYGRGLWTYDWGTSLPPCIP